jgi:hypothetical protein
MRFFNDMRIRDKIFVGYLLAIMAVIGVAVVATRRQRSFTPSTLLPAAQR